MKDAKEEIVAAMTKVNMSSKNTMRARQNNMMCPLNGQLSQSAKPEWVCLKIECSCCVANIMIIMNTIMFITIVTIISIMNVISVA